MFVKANVFVTGTRKDMNLLVNLAVAVNYDSVMFYSTGPRTRQGPNFMKVESCGLYYNPMMVANDDSRVVNQLKASLTDNARVVIYDCHMFIEQATSVFVPG